MYGVRLAPAGGPVKEYFVTRCSPRNGAFSFLGAKVGTLDWTHLLVQAGLVIVPLGAAGYMGLRKVLWQLGEFPPHKHLNGRIDYPEGVNAKDRGLAQYIGKPAHHD
jgi:hypothetical protein